MNVLLLSSRFPWPSFTGDRLRAAIWIEALQRVARVTLVAPPGEVPVGRGDVTFYPARPSAVSAMRGTLRVAAGAPLQSMLAARFDFADAIERVRADFGTIHATVVLLSRLDVVVRDCLPPGLHVLDAVDSLHRSMRERERRSPALTRWLWRAEAARVAIAERSAVRTYDRTIVVSGEDAAELSARVASNGVAIAPLGTSAREFDFGFWGRLAYFANDDAVRWLVDDIWPQIRSQHPRATLLIAGAEAPPWLRRLDGRDGIRVTSPAADIAELARRVKIALFPVRFGTGQSNKVLEAAEAGCAIVATPTAMRGLPELQALASVAADAQSLALAAAALLRDGRSKAEGAALREAVQRHYDRARTLEQLAAIVRMPEAAA